MSLDDLLKECQRRRIILFTDRRGRVRCWSPTTYVSKRIRLAVHMYSEDIARLIYRLETSVCPLPELHRESWSYAICRYCCNICARLRWEAA